MLNEGDYQLELIAALHNHSWLLKPGEGELILRFSIKGGSIGSSFMASTTRPGVLFSAYAWQAG
jgi:hypothetical protein